MFWFMKVDFFSSFVLRVKYAFLASETIETLTDIKTVQARIKMLSLTLFSLANSLRRENVTAEVFVFTIIT